MVNFKLDLNALRVFLPRDYYGPCSRSTVNNTTQLMHLAVTVRHTFCFAVISRAVMAKRKAPSPSPSGTGSDIIHVAPTRNVRPRLFHLAPKPSFDGRPFRTVDFVLIPRDERPSEDELSTVFAETSKPYFDRPSIINGKRSRRQTAERRNVGDLWGMTQSPGRDSSHPPPPHSPGVIDLTTDDTPDPPSFPAAQIIGPTINLARDESSQDVSRSSSQRPRRSTARQSYVEAASDAEDEEDVIVYETSSGSRRSGRMMKASTHDSDFEHEGSEDESEIGVEEEAELEESEPEAEDSTDEGYDSGVKLKGRSTTKKANSTVKSSVPTTQGRSKTGKQTGKTTVTEMHKLLGRGTGEPKGLDTGLPPLSSIDDIFKDITAKALGLGLKEVLQKTKMQSLRVATMCSGTESPLLALEMVQDALKSLGEPDLQLDHLFSAEIVPYKQAYIERNFLPKIIFRDITEITSSVKEAFPTATTVYGAKVPIPGNVHILIAGTSCVDFSRLNKHRKDLDEEAGGESSKTWFGVLSYVKAFRPAIVILENVKNAPYDHMMHCYRDIGYEVGGVLLDSKNYYLPQTRQRGYLVCFDKSKASAGKLDGAGKAWEQLMSKFRRPASSSVAEFMLPNDQIRAQQTSLDDNSKEYDWAACEIRHIQYRQEKRLGNARPLTFWSESGTMNVPENGFIPWYRKQPERVRDYMDVAFLRKAHDFDVRYKTRIWDVSQNVDMFGDGAHFGIAPCITPSGLFFASDAGRALAPEEVLTLQGLPLSKISFTTETASEIQDMGGNAMTTTAVGPAILAALICGSPAICNDKAILLEDVSMAAVSQPKFTNVATAPVVSSKHSARDLDLSDLLDRAARSARRCLCKGSAGIARKAIQECIDCEHTTCTRCGGNPTHNYRIVKNVKRSSPVEFDAHLRSQLPQSLTFGDEFVSKWPGVSDEHGYLSVALAAAQNTFTFSRVQRTHVWTVVYRATTARLELRLDGQRASWQLFALPSKTLPVKDELRKLLETPIATAKCDRSLLDGTWLWRLSPYHNTSQVRINGVGQRIASWLARLELPNYRDQQVWSRLQIRVPSEISANIRHDLNGEYEALPLCGTAGNSLYKKLDTMNDEQIYLLRNPTRTDDPKLDSFVFSTEKQRLDFGIQRPVIATLNPEWAPCNNGKAFESATLTPSGDWQNLNSHLQEVDLQAIAHAPVSLGHSQLDCQHAELVLGCDFASRDHDNQDSREISSKDERFFARHAHIFETMRRQLPPTEWRQLSLSHSDCDSCAPRKPGLRWMLTDAQAIKPYEDPASAATYERAIKSRPEPMLFQVSPSGTQTVSLQFGINLATLAHRAVSRLPTDSGSRLTWNLEQNLSAGVHRRDPFVLRDTVGSASPEDIGMSCKLFPKQALVLDWMQQQELGKSFTVEEAEEAIVPALGWRAEVRAELDITVRGGICADHPGFGKTITSLALIHSQLMSGRDIVADISTRQKSDGTRGLIPTKATLIVAPNTLVRQWASEIRDKLGYNQEVIVVSGLKDLDKHSIDDFQKAKIILVNRTVLGHADYAERLASFAAMPGPATNSGRAFSQWLAHACKAIPEHLSILQTSGLEALRNHVKSRYAELVGSEDFRAIVPSRRLVGKDYVESKGKATKTVKPALRAVPTANLGRPLFEQFFFNRIIIDEFHQYTPREYASLKALKADKRWGLSGTPALTDFYDIAQIADLLGVPLRIGSGSTRTMAERNVRALRKEMTDFERFDAMREVPSDCMHARIHEIAQPFLDTFVRQNVMDFIAMTYDDYLVPVTLDVDHQAAYTELSQQLASQEMNIRKAKKSKTTTRDKRFMDAIADVDTAEEALSKDAAYFKRSGDLRKGLEHMIKARQSEVDSMLKDLERACSAAQHEVKEENQPLQQMADTLIKQRTLGDKETIDHVSRILRSTANPNAMASKKVKPKKSTSDSEDEGEKAKEGKETSKARELTAKVNALAKGLLTTIRSERYIKNVQSIREHSTAIAKCDSESCSADGKHGQKVAVSALCGHRVCQQCHESAREQHRIQCATAGCSASQQDHHLLWSHKLKQSGETSSHGAKLEAALQLIARIQNKGEKAILFVQFPEQVQQASTALKQHSIATTVVAKDTAGAQIASFCKNKDTVLVLNASDETAAGSNIQAANHVIFLSPLLRDNQYAYDSTMAQAVGRVRRHDQERHIHVYRICALHTIDVDILEHREHRTNALAEPGAAAIKPPIAAVELDQHDPPKGDRVQLVKENGSYSLRPKSWLYRCGVDDDEGGMVTAQDWGRVAGWEDFSSQVKFSRAFAGDD
jgi:site-specific DNA-cytosine methylase